MNHEQKQSLFNYFHELTDGKVLLMEDDYSFIESAVDGSEQPVVQHQQDELWKEIERLETSMMMKGGNTDGEKLNWFIENVKQLIKKEK